MNFYYLLTKRRGVARGQAGHAPGPSWRTVTRSGSMIGSPTGFQRGGPDQGGPRHPTKRTDYRRAIAGRGDGIRGAAAEVPDKGQYPLPGDEAGVGPRDIED